MSQNTIIRLAMVFTLMFPALSSYAQEQTEKTGDNAPKSVADEKETSSKPAVNEPKADLEEPEEADDQNAEAAAAEDEEQSEIEESEDADETLDDETDDNLKAEEEEEESADEPMTLAPPKTVELDMSALGSMDPEKELAEGGELDQKVAETEKETWTERALDILELKGYFRVRPELYHKFSIRGDDAIYNRTMSQRQSSSKYNSSTSTGANMRFRLAPIFHISEEVRINTQMDFLDNVMLGSTPRYYQGYDPVHEGDDYQQTLQIGRVQGWNMGAPSSDDMLVVRRVWGEVATPFGQLRFGRMGDHFGTGMLHNDGNQLFNDFGDTVDRIMFAAKINDWLIAPAFDFPNEGIVGSDASGRPFDFSQLDDAYRLVGIFAYLHDKEVQEAMLRRGDWLVNTGLYFSYRWQILSFESEDQEGFEYDPTLDSSLSDVDGEDDDYDFFEREMWTITPDFWFQLLYKTFHFELEAALIFGKIENPEQDEEPTDNMDKLTLLQWGGVLQIDYGLLNDALRIGLEFGYAHGDKDVEGIRAPATYDQYNNQNDDTFSAFSFNPAYNTDLILHRHIIGSVSQSFYLNAWLQYDFLKQKMGQKLGVRADVHYSRAIFSESTISNNSANLGVELNAQIRYQTADGFYAGLAYGVLFPLGGFKGDPDEDEEDDLYDTDNDLSIPQTVQTVLGITF